MEPCRKCGTPNPEANQYCRGCGAVLNVSTAMVEAQRSLLLPASRGIKLRWIALGAASMLGFAAVLVGALVVVVGATAGAAAGGGSVADRLRGLPIAASVVLLLAFGLGGVSVAWMSRGRTVLEPVISSLAVLALLGAAASTLSADAVWVAALLALPGALLAGLGGWVGELFGKGGRAR